MLSRSVFLAFSLKKKQLDLAVWKEKFSNQEKYLSAAKENAEILNQEVLRQPLEDRKVTISRAMGNFTFPSDFICVAAMNPCPCGYLGHPDKRCKDTQMQIDRYRGKISGPLWDRIDMHIEVPALRYHDISQGLPGESSVAIRERVKAARQRQYQRFGLSKINAQMTARELRQHCPLSTECHDILRQAVDSFGISARACDRLVRVAMTIADLAHSPQLQEEHLMEALAFRQLQVESLQNTFAHTP